MIRYKYKPKYEKAGLDGSNERYSISLNLQQECTSEEVEVLRQEVEYAAREICGIFYGSRKITLGFHHRMKRRINVSLDDTMSCAFRNEVVINRSLFKANLAPIVHELCHVFAYSPNASLCEGVANYCQELFGHNYSLFNFGLDVHSLAHLILETVDFRAAHDVGCYQGSAFALMYSRAHFQVVGHSFVKYLVETYKMEQFLRLYDTRGRALDYTRVYGKSLHDIRHEWISFLNRHGMSLTKEQVIIHIQNICESSELDRAFFTEMINVLLDFEK
ncbi:hypothetical protein FACS18947_6640 [Bacteroidia bacterium]|nr:hypothetical protein FACS18947_6640 [Bacteroidia bacterium]